MLSNTCIRPVRSLESFRSRVVEFARENVAPLAASIDAQNRFPNHLWQSFGKAGLLGLTIPKSLGGEERRLSEICVAVEEISRFSGSIGLSYAVHTHLVVNAINAKGNEKQRQKLLPKLISGEQVGCVAISEPNAGSDVLAMETTAKRSSCGSYYTLNGSKMWITNGPDANVMIVYAKTDPNAGSKGITVFLVETSHISTNPGGDSAKNNIISNGNNTNNLNKNRIIRGPLLDKMGMRGSNTCLLEFDDFDVPSENILGEVNKGVYVLMAGLDMERLVMSAAPVGLMKGALFDSVLPYVHQRKQFGSPIAEFQLMQAKLADMYTKYRVSSSFLEQMATQADLDPSAIDRKDCAALIHICSQNAISVGLDAIQALGGIGYTRESQVERILRDAKMYEIGGGTTEIRRMLIGREFNDIYLGRKKMKM